MEGNNGKGNNEGRDRWKSPRVLFNMLDRQYDFDFDCCAEQDNTQCDDFSDEFETVDNDKLDQLNCWMNPPFSKAEEMFKHFFKAVSQGVAIYRCDNFETKLWQDVIFPHASWILIPKRRVSYEGMKGKGSRFPSALIGYNIEEPKIVKGTLLFLNKE